MLAIYEQSFLVRPKSFTINVPPKSTLMARRERKVFKNGCYVHVFDMTFGVMESMDNAVKVVVKVAEK